MARSTFKNFQSAVRSMYAQRFAFSEAQGYDHDYDNAKSLTWSDAADTTSIGALVVDANSRIHLDHQVMLGVRQPMTFNLKANASLGTQAFFIADRAMVISGVEYTHSTAGSDAGAVSAQIFHDSGTQAPGTGVAITTAVFNCKSVANTVQVGTLLAVDGNGNPNTGITLAAGDRLSIVFTGTLTALAGVVVSVYSYAGFKEGTAQYVMNASPANAGFFLANRDALITGVKMIWSTAGTDAGAVTIDVTHETGTTAPAGGTSILTAAQSAKTAANTVASPALTGTASALSMAAGDRLSVKFTGTLTALAGVVVVVYFQCATLTPTTVGYYGQNDINFNLAANSALGTQEFFVSDRDYEVVDASIIWSTAGTDGGAVTADFQVDKLTTAPGSGTSVASATVSAKGTANTTNVFTMSTSRRNRLLSQGDRLCIVLTGTLTSLAGVDATVSLVPR